MKIIPLTQGLFALVSDEDFEYLNRWKWYAAKPNPKKNKWYARRVDHKNKKRPIYMHRVITNAPPGLEPDHINHNTLDNRRENLSLGTHLDNMKNLLRKSNTGYRGVKRLRKTDRFFAQIAIGKKHIYLGLFSSAEEAAKAYDEAAKQHRGKSAFLNFPE
jgi:hypothetical protein